MARKWYYSICVFWWLCSLLPVPIDALARTLFVPQDAVIGHRLIDLRNYYSQDPSLTSSTYSIDTTNDYSHLLAVDGDGVLDTTGSLSTLLHSQISVDVLQRGFDPTGRVFERVIPLTVSVIPPGQALRFTASRYRGSIASFTPSGRLIPGLDTVAVFVPDGPNLLDPRFQLDPPSDLFQLVTISDDKLQTPHAQIYTARTVRKSDVGIHKFVVTANAQGHIVLTDVLIDVQDHVARPPIFTATRYVATIDSHVPPGSNILRVKVRSSGAATFRLKGHPSLNVDIDALSGNIFTLSRNILPGTYHFNVIATNSEGGEATTFVKIVVEDSLQNGSQTVMKKYNGDGSLSRVKRNLRDEIVIEVPETQPLGILPQHTITLGGNMRIKNTPVRRQYFTVYANGSIQLTRLLNYETIKDHAIRFSVIVENIQTLQDSPQPITVTIRDVDEPPRFINAPLPYLAVVPPRVPVGYGIYKFTARDENGDGDSDVLYKLISTEPEGMFKVDPDGRVKTLKQYYQEGESYRVYVQAEDLSSTDPNMKYSDIAVLDVVGGSRPPQFFEQKYHVDVPENTPVQSSVVRIQAYSFERESGQVVPIQFSMLVDSPASNEDPLSTAFTIDTDTGVVHLRRSLDHDQPSEPRFYKFKVTANEDGKVSQVGLEINVTDVNDNAPYFTQPLYAGTIDEDFPIGQPILTVSARDKDSGTNSEIEFSVSDGNFSVNERGEISPRVTLDADQQFRGFYIYRFDVIAKDKGIPQRTATSKVQIRTDNVNDEKPIFRPTAQYMAYVAEDSQGSTPIVTVQAQDPDKDQVRYHFKNPNGGVTQEMGLFSIDTDTGLVKLRSGVRGDELRRQDMYNLTVVAVDDGSCCNKGRSSAPHRSEATVVIGVADVNNNKPVFDDCDSYSAKARVPEGKHLNFTIINVRASDEDSGRNGDIVYTLYYPKSQTRKPFIIDSTTGDLKASPYVDFDREQRPYEDVTVKATDKGDRPLIGFCQFTVTVEDLNDNAPQFDRASYETYISRSTAVGHSVITVFADDRDAPQNARITYRLSPDTSLGNQLLHDRDVSYFHIRQDSGEITLISALPPNREKFRFLVEASDGGKLESKTSQVAAIINVRGNEQSNPKWIPSPDCPDQVTFDENTQINTIFFRCHALSGSNPNNPISYSMRNGVKSTTNGDQDFREFFEKESGKDWVVIRNLRGLDFEKTRSYTLTLSAQDLKNGNSIDKTVVVNLRDKNDEIPKFKLDQFSGHVLEELEPAAVGKPVANVVAHDADTPNTPASRVKYSLLEGEASNLFRIDPNNGEIYATKKFDRELNDSFILDVQAEDGAMSDLPGARGPNKDITRVQVIVQDVNDNPPFFNQTVYLGIIKENAEVGQNVMTVKAHDKDRDSTLKYSLIPDRNSAHSGAFGVRANSGTIFVSEALDFETKKVYHMGLRVTDGKFEAETRIEINVTDVNDNAPQFDRPHYSIRIVEEDNNVPKHLLTVKATDRDLDEASRDIIYRIEGQGAGEFFTVDKRSGVIQVIKPLDRDPPNGAPIWNFIVQAIDDGGRGLVGYSDVQVTLEDINDNAPIFPGGSARGHIEENKEPGRNGVYVMTMTATDYDDPLTPNAQITYSIRANKIIDNVPIFEIEPSTGKIFAKIKLDRENTAHREFEIEVDAADRGTPRALRGSGRAIIKVVDVNDNAPFFKRPIYNVTVPETAHIHSPVLTLSASDVDNEAEDNVLQYDLVDDDGIGTEYFYMTSDPDSHQSYVGNLRVNKKLDYEDARQRDGFTVTVKVFDGKFYARTTVRVHLEDRNDNPPAIHGPKLLSVKEDVRIKTNIANFTATDLDLGGRDTHMFRINRTSDDQRQFFISAEGNLFVARALDRETKPNYNLIIEAEDSAGNVGTSHVSIQVIDVNDNAPDLDPNPNPPIVWENEPPGALVATVKCTDKDTAQNGPPFTMLVPETSPYRNKFRMVFDKAGDNGNGEMKVYTTMTFDREGGEKTMSVPIQVADSGDPVQSKTRYLDILIGDKNDNPMSDGEKNIFVYNYKGQMPRSVIGRVYVTDLDDWDLADKTFQWMGMKQPAFDIDKNTGDILMDPGVEDGRYELRVQVTDSARNEQAVGTVFVTVQTLPEQAFLNSGSLLIRGVTAEDFIEKHAQGSLYDIFRNKVAEYLDVSPEGVQVFSLMDQDQEPPLLEVYFAAHNSPYRKATQLNGVLQTQRMDLEAALGGNELISIVQINYDLCARIETCDDGCFTARSALTRPTVVGGNQTTLVGVTVKNVKTCGCRKAFVPTTCTRDTCQNNGICHHMYPGFFCECRGPFSGARCEERTISFQGDGYSWFEPISACSSSHIHFKFMTQSDGLIFYNGPMREMVSKLEDTVDNPDFIAVYVEGGKLKMKLNLGKGAGLIEIANRIDPVSDGLWHDVDIYFDKQDVEISLDGCKEARVTEPVGRSTQQRIPGHYSPCLGTGRIPGDDEQLTVTDPLQIGGMAPVGAYAYPHVPVKVGFNGCIRDMRVGDKRMNLGKPAAQKNMYEGCIQTENKCTDNSLAGPGYCLNGMCIASMGGNTPKCQCNPGWSGPTCNQKLEWMSFDLNSFIKYWYKAPMSSMVTDIKVLFLPDQPNGELAAMDNNGIEYIRLQLNNWVPSAVWDMGDGAVKQLTVQKQLQRNQSYWLHLTRNRNRVYLSIDGQFQEKLPDNNFEQTAIKYDPKEIFLGGRERNGYDGFQGCIADYRLFDQYMPLSYEDQELSYVSIEKLESVTRGCPRMPTCQAGMCKSPFICMDLWKGPFCTCPTGMAVTLDADGRLIACGENLAELKLGLSGSAVAAILVCLLVLIVLVLIMVVYSRRRRPIFHEMPPDDIRENIINYADEGGGEEDQDTYNIAPLRKPVLPLDDNGDYPRRINTQPTQRPPDPGDVDAFIRDRLAAADSDPAAPPYDELRVYTDEGDGISVASLSSISSAGSMPMPIDEQLTRWGPRFNRLADMYSGQDD